MTVHPGKPGTRGRYVSGCRCKACTTANREYVTAYLAGLRLAPTPEHVHGSRNGYSNYGCRCEACKTAHHDAMARQYAKRKAVQS